MHDLNLNLFYKTSFDIEPTTKNGDALWSLFMSIRYWISRKWSRNGVKVPQDNRLWSKLKLGARLYSTDEEQSVRIESAAFNIGTGVGEWACRITETFISENAAPRQWVTEVGFTERKAGSARVSIVLSYGDQPGFIGPVNDDPTPSIPNLIKALMRNKRVKCTVSGMPLSMEAAQLSAGDYPLFWKLISNRQRETAVVYVSPRFDQDGNPQLLVNPDELASMLGPSAIVVFTTDKGFCAELAYLLPDRNLRCNNGSVRVYASSPKFDDPDDCRRHRFFHPELIESIGEEQVALFLRKALAQDVSSYESVTRLDTVRALRRRHALETKTHEAAESKARKKVERAENQALEWVREVESERDDAKAECDRLSEENDKLKLSIFSLKGRIALLEMRGAQSQADIDVSRYPDTAECVANMLVSAFPDRIDFTDRGWRSLDECASSPSLVWEALYSLCTIAYDVYTGKPGASMEDAFKSKSHFDYSPSAGMMTENARKFKREYLDKYEGREIDCGAHIGKGNVDGNPRSIRVYFCFDKKSRKVIVSSCGDHLPNHTGQFMK